MKGLRRNGTENAVKGAASAVPLRLEPHLQAALAEGEAHRSVTAPALETRVGRTLRGEVDVPAL